MRYIAFLFLLLVLLSSCQRNKPQSLSKEVLSKKQAEVQIDSGLVILTKENGRYGMNNLLN